MCYKGHFLYCIPVQTACLVLAIINVILNVLNLIWYTFLWGAILMMYKYRKHITDMDEFKELDGEVNLDIRTWDLITGHIVFWFGFVPLASLLTVIFSFVLCIGISNRRPGQVKTYLVYGVTITLFGFVASVALMCVNRSLNSGLVVLAICVMHSFFLLLVLETYNKLLDEGKIADRRHLMREDSSFSTILRNHRNSDSDISQTA